MVYDYLKSSVQTGRFVLPIAANQKGSYAELMTIALVGELRSQDHVGDWFDLVKVEYRVLFPKLPHRTRYYRVLKRLERIFADFALRFSAGDTLHVIDSKPLPICKGVRWKRSRAMTEATSGRGGLGPFYGFKLHAVTDQQGLICRFAIVPAHEHDVTVARCLLADTTALVIGDKGYVGSGVYAQSKDNARHPRIWTSALAWLRKSIESVFSSLLRSRHILAGQLNSFSSIRASVCRKIAAHNLAWFLTH
jgi:transposase